MKKRKFSKKTLFVKSMILINLIFFYGCAGTINTVRQTEQPVSNYKKVFIISSDNSQYIKFKFGVITPIAYIVLPDDTAQNHEKIGNTEIVIKQELEKYGIKVDIGINGDVPKSSSFEELTNEKLYEIQEKINNRPRKRFNFESPNYMFNQKVAFVT